MKPSFIALLVAALCACEHETPRPSGAPSAAATAQGCAGLAAHWRSVWGAEARPGLEQRTRRAADLAAAAWTHACSETSASPASLADLDRLRQASRFAGIKTLDPATASGSLGILIRAIQTASQKTEQAMDCAPASGVVECEEAIAQAAFCGNDVDRAAVRSAAKGKDDGACAALGVLVAKKCVD